MFEERFSEVIIAGDLGSLRPIIGFYRDLIFAGGAASSCAPKSSWIRSKKAAIWLTVTPGTISCTSDGESGGFERAHNCGTVISGKIEAIREGDRNVYSGLFKPAALRFLRRNGSIG